MVVAKLVYKKKYDNFLQLLYHCFEYIFITGGGLLFIKNIEFFLIGPIRFKIFNSTDCEVSVESLKQADFLRFLSNLGDNFGNLKFGLYQHIDRP